MAMYDINGKILTSVDADSSVLTKRVIENPNLANPELFTIGLLASTGSVNTAQGDCNTTNFIPVTEGKILTIGFIHHYNHNPWFIATWWVEWCSTYAFYSSDKSTVVASGSVKFSANSATGIEVPSGASYVRASWTTYGGSYYFYPVQTPEKCFVIESDKAVQNPTYYFADGIEKEYIPASMLDYTNSPPYHGKTWTLFGDSLTDACAGHGWDAETNSVGGVGWTSDNTYVEWTGHLWASRIARELGLVVDNRAKSGSNINEGENGNYTDVSGVAILNDFIAEIEDGTIECPDYITVGFGSNTRANQIGAIDDDSTVTTSVYGAMKYFIEKLRYLQKNYNQNMVFGFVLPPQSGWTGNTRLQEGRQAMLEQLKVEEYAVPYCDMWTESGITIDMLTDGIHIYTIESNNLYYHAMRRFMMGL